MNRNSQEGVNQNDVKSEHEDNIMLMYHLMIRIMHVIRQLSFGETK